MKPLRTLVAGMSHGHVNWLLNRDPSLRSIEIVGWQEANERHRIELAAKHSLAATFADLPTAIRETRPEAILGFGAVDEHYSVVEAAARLKLPVMLEKPLAQNLAAAEAIARLARESGITVYVNYETSHYPSLDAALSLYQLGELGELRRLEFWTGHQGPAARGAKPEFLEWLHDPARGGGALLDFGCYGAALSTHWHGGALPLSVMAYTENFRPDLHPAAESDATILLSYERSQTIIQASWTWPDSRKEMSAAGTKGRVHQRNATDMEIIRNGKPELILANGPMEDGFTKFAEALRGTRYFPEHHPATLENALTVMRILEAAKHSAASGRACAVRK